ncbi:MULTISPECIES: hypothetical protein [unclassified Kribbella]|uniref:hypothetical protein n=1 Tax=unclassified Kribbella TaxID=2644121 RepID=UPI003410191E
MVQASNQFLFPPLVAIYSCILGLKARDIMGYTFTMFLACFPAALVGVTLLAPHVTG